VETNAAAIWKQEVIPVIYRQGDGQPLMIKLLYSSDNAAWLRNDNRRKPKWNKKFTCWQTPNAWFKSLIQRALHRTDGLCFRGGITGVSLLPVSFGK
jgi:hypothetical protein